MRHASIALLILLLLPSAILAQNLDPYTRATQEQYPFKRVPFGNGIIDNIFERTCAEFGDCSNDAKSDFYQMLYGIREIRYAYQRDVVPCPFFENLCPDNIIWRRFDREFTFNIDQFRVGLVNSILDLGYRGCDFLNVYLTSRTGQINGSTFRISGRYVGKRRLCDDFLGDLETASTRGNFEVSLLLNVEAASIPFAIDSDDIGESLSIDPSHRVFNRDSDFLGIFDTGTFFGKLVSRLLFIGPDVIAVLFNKDTFAARLKLLDEVGNDIDFTGLSSQLARQSSAVTSISDVAPEVLPFGLAGFRYRLDAGKTGFVILDGELHLRVAQFAAVPDTGSAAGYIPLLFANEQQNSLRIIDSFSQTESIVEVEAGDTLENISEEWYGSRDLSFYVAWKNRISNPNLITIEQEIVMVPYWNILQDFEDYNLVGFGSSYYEELVGSGLSAAEAMAAISERELSDFVFPLAGSANEQNGQ